MHNMGARDASPAVDLTSCDREEIQFLGQVQSIGCLIAVSADWMVAHASANCLDILGLDPHKLIGTPFAEALPGESLHLLRSHIQMLVDESSVSRVFGADLLNNGKTYDVSIHRSDRTVILEFERKSDGISARANSSTVQALVTRLRRETDLGAFFNEGVRCMSAMTNMRRVMIYRFEADGTGTVVAEAKRGNDEPYLGLRYPASDIPRQARALYERSPLRIISDVDAEVYSVLPSESPGGGRLDLSLAVTRAVSPIHLEYLRNMGVKASLSISILRRGKLWGLFACHHNAPHVLDYESRSALELFGQLFSYELAQLETDKEQETTDRARQLQDAVMMQMSSGQCEGMHEIFDALADKLNEVIPHDGMAVYSDGVYQAKGSAPSEEEFLSLSRFLNTAQTSEVLSIDNLADCYPDADVFADRVAGLLALPISRTPRDYLVLFRREVAKSVKWAGNPDKPAELGPNGIRLTPRKSFEAWTEIVRGKSAPWLPSELQTAEALRIALLEVVLKLSDEAADSRKRAQEQQDLLIAELNHRVRNILNLIRGLVAQGKGDAKSIEEYSKVLDHRIHSLARAHDQLTRREWAWVSLSGLIRTEVDAFLSSKATRVELTGDEIELSPTAFTTMALVVHELVTNSAKYGALSDSMGQVAINTSLTADGSASVSWEERNGPPVQAPKRKGFGTTIIEKSVPFELKGQADLSYKMSGLAARFVLPSRHVARVTAVEPDPPVKSVATVSEVRIQGEVLVVEDNMIIAMDAHDMMTKLGASTVHVFSNVLEAKVALAEIKPAIALLDVNLGDETSLPIAMACRERGIPIVLATGYGASPDVLATFPDAPICTKPYTMDDLRAAVADVLR